MFLLSFLVDFLAVALHAAVVVVAVSVAVAAVQTVAVAALSLFGSEYVPSWQLNK